MIDATAARRVRLVGLDVDGVLTEGGVYLGDVEGASHEFKRYDIQDGLGIHLLKMAGIIPVIVTGRVSESVRLRAKELEIDDVVQVKGAFKVPPFMAVLERHAVSLEEAAFIGDDLPDIPVLELVGLRVCVANATREVRELCHVRLTRPGGGGAVREFVEHLLDARGDWERVMQGYLDERRDGERPRDA
jgi:3-deoxy-D-manno-octulosonate 8-phosphate phosphatase (KDO 8-P phosphatase)